MNAGVAAGIGVSGRMVGSCVVARRIGIVTVVGTGVFVWNEVCGAVVGTMVCWLSLSAAIGRLPMRLIPIMAIPASPARSRT